MSEQMTVILISAAVSAVIGIIQIIVVTIDARRTAREVSEDLVQKELEKRHPRIRL